MKVRDAIREAAEKLAATSESARLDAELIAAHILGVSREEMLLNHLDGDINGDGYRALLTRRILREPLAYITETKEFWGLSLKTTPGTLIPRPDSETLIETAIAHLSDAPPATILDLGTGTGALLLAALSQWPEAHGTGVDASDTALACAQENAERLGFATRTQFIRSDWAESVTGSFDLIFCNPPYVEDAADLAPDVRDYEPSEALFSGADGLDDIRILALQIPALLSKTGIACFEIGHTQASAVIALFAQQSLKTAIHTDIAGRDRCILIHR